MVHDFRVRKRICSLAECLRDGVGSAKFAPRIFDVMKVDVYLNEWHKVAYPQLTHM